MRHDIETREFERTFQAPARKWSRPKLALRQRSNDHPIAMFSAVAAAAFLSMAFIPTAGPAFASIGKPSQPLRLVEDVRSTAKGDRIVPSSVDTACRGQAWGSENLECITVIAKESGNEVRTVRMIASAEPNSAAPNIF